MRFNLMMQDMWSIKILLCTVYWRIKVPISVIRWTLMDSSEDDSTRRLSKFINNIHVETWGTNVDEYLSAKRQNIPKFNYNSWKLKWKVDFRANKPSRRCTCGHVLLKIILNTGFLLHFDFEGQTVATQLLTLQR